MSRVIYISGKEFEIDEALLRRSRFFNEKLDSLHGSFKVKRSSKVFEHVYAYLLDPNYPYPKKHYRELEFYGIEYKLDDLYDPLKGINEELLGLRNEVAKSEAAKEELRGEMAKTKEELAQLRNDMTDLRKFITQMNSNLHEFVGQTNDNFVVINNNVLGMHNDLDRSRFIHNGVRHCRLGCGAPALVYSKYCKTHHNLYG